MSSITERTEAVEAGSTEAEHPFRGLKEGWRVVGRGSGIPQRVRTRLEVSLDPDESDWLTAAAGRAGLTGEAFVKAVLDAARRAEARNET